MRLKMVESDAESIRLELEGVPTSLGNAIRRAVINEVPCMAVEEVLVIENTSPLPNEILAHRISLIPFISDIDSYNFPEECSCNSRLGCDRCVVRYVLRAEAGETPVTVYSRDLIPEKPNTKVVPVNGDIPIVILPPGERVEMELYVRVGRGMKHAKWQAGLASLYEEDGRQYLYVESFGFLPVKRMLLEAVKIVRRRVAELGERLDEAVANAK
ncbi:DNA-directed RNA polymerase subunit alpha [archaeon HR01]|nr:DNA-directed RNA polymerase subunit alpha [archaeon HR01]